MIDEFNIQYDGSISMAEDYDLWAWLLEHGKGINLPEVLLYYRKDGSNDSVIHAVDMQRESNLIRKRIIERSSKNSYEKKWLINEIYLEEQKDKSIIDTIKVYLFYKKYLNKYIDKNHPDYSVLKLHTLLRVYGTCIYGNSRIYAKLLNRIYMIG